MRISCITVGLIHLALLGCHAAQPSQNYLHSARAVDAAGTQILKIPYDPATPGYEYIPVLATPNYADPNAPQLGFKILCKDKTELEQFLSAIGALEAYRAQAPAYAAPDFPSETVKRLNMDAQPALRCAQDRDDAASEAGALKHDISKPLPNHYLRFANSQIENIGAYYFQLGCEGLISGLGYNAATAGAVNIASVKAEYPNTREITINCPAGKDFAADPFVEECEAAMKSSGNGLHAAYRDLMTARDVANLSCSTLYSGLKDVTDLTLDNTGLKDLRPLGHLKKLEGLSLQNNAIEDATPLSLLPQLKKLNLGRNYYLSNISKLGQLTKLTELKLDNTGVQTLSSLSTLRDLQTLDISYVALEASELDNLRGLLKLQTLDYDKDYLPWDPSRQTFFSTCALMKDLPDDVKGTFKNILTSLVVNSDPNGLVSLAKCNLAYSRARSKTELNLKPFKLLPDKTCLRPSGLLNLAEFKKMALQLDYSFCKLGAIDLAELGKLPKLASVDLSQNGLEDLRPLKGWAGIESMLLNLEGNPAEGETCPGDSNNPTLTAFCMRSSNPFVAECQQGQASSNWPVYRELFKKQGVNSGRCVQLHDSLKLIVALDLSGVQLPSLAPLGYLTQLQTLKIPNTGTTDIKALATLVNLTELDISGNRNLADLNGVENLALLKKVTISETAVSSLQPLSKALNLESLFAEKNINLSFSAFDALNETNLSSINIAGSPVRWTPSEQSFYTNCLLVDLLPLDQRKTVGQMIRALGFVVDDENKTSVSCGLIVKTLANQSIYDLSGFKFQPKDEGEASAKCLSLLPLATLRAFSNLKDIRLDFAACGFDENAAADLLSIGPALKILNLKQNRISSLQPWIPFFKDPAAASLALQLDGNLIQPENCPISSGNRSVDQFCVNQMPFTIACKSGNYEQGIGPTMKALFALIDPSVQSCEDKFIALHGLTEMDLKFKEMTNINPLRGLSKLVKLDLGENYLTNVEALSGLTGLTDLSLGNHQLPSVPYIVLVRNQVQDISPLKNLKNLTRLDLARNKLIQTEALKDLENLSYLDLSMNELSTVESLRGLTKLKTLNLSDNFIQTVEPLRALVNLTGLDLARNPIPPSTNHCPNNSPSTQLNAVCTYYYLR